MWTVDSKLQGCASNPAAWVGTRARQRSIPGPWWNIFSLEPERVTAVTAELFAEALAVANAVRRAQGRGPVTSFRARDFREILKDLVDCVVEQ